MTPDQLADTYYGTTTEAQITECVALDQRGDATGVSEIMRDMDFGLEWDEAQGRHVNVAPEWDVIVEAGRLMAARRAAEDRARATAVPVGLVEIADRLGVQRATVDQWRARGLLPEPRWTVGGRPAWSWLEIAEWATETGRLAI